MSLYAEAAAYEASKRIESLNFYLTKMEFELEMEMFGKPAKTGVKKVLQLVKAKDKESAREAVKIEAVKEFGEKITIYEIRVDDTLDAEKILTEPMASLNDHL